MKPSVDLDDLGELRSHFEERRAQAIRDTAAIYGVTLHRHPRKPHAAVISESDYGLLRAVAPAHVQTSYSGAWLDSDVSLIVMPDWTCNPDTVALVRARALIESPIRRFIRHLDAALGGGTTQDSLRAAAALGRAAADGYADTAPSPWWTREERRAYMNAWRNHRTRTIEDRLTRLLPTASPDKENPS